MSGLGRLQAGVCSSQEVLPRGACALSLSKRAFARPLSVHKACYASHS